MLEEGIEQHYTVFKQQKITGASLLELKALLSTEPTQTTRLYLVEGCNISSRGELLAINAALRRLSTNFLNLM
jgi:hypothetical protein